MRISLNHKPFNLTYPNFFALFPGESDNLCCQKLNIRNMIKIIKIENFREELTTIYNEILKLTEWLEEPYKLYDLTTI